MEDIRVERFGAHTEIVLARPAKKNALTRAMYARLAEALREADADDAVAAAMICADGGAFTAGNDIADFMAFALDPAAPALTEVGEFLDMLTRFQKPLVAAVEGPAVGVGTTMLLHCDLVYADPSARFSTPFVDLGLTPEGGSSLLAPARFGHARAFRLLGLGEAIDAETARKWGLVTAVAELGEARAAARTACEALKAKPRQALLAAKRLMRGDLEPLRARMREEAALFLERLRSEEAGAAFASFMAKR